MEPIISLDQLTKDDVAAAGGKGASLGELLRAGLPVPPGFAVTTAAFRDFLATAGLEAEIAAALERADTDQVHTVEDAAQTIRGLILSAAVPDSLKQEIEKTFDALDSTQFVAVRSSATAEDGANAAWAGQLDTFLNVTRDGLADRVRECWASLFTPRAIHYRLESGQRDHDVAVAVVVQKMAAADTAGVAFSVHPVTEDRNQLIIEGSYGLGEAVVSGQVTPDSYVVSKEPREIVERTVNVQRRGLYRSDAGGNEWRDLPDELGRRQVLDDGRILELAETVIRIEQHYGFPCDIEWCFEGDRLYILQSRPITTLH